MNGDLELAPLGLRALVYAGTIATAGGALFAATFPAASYPVSRLLRWQLWLGAGLLMVVEPLRYILFQLSIAGGDASLAFSPEMRWIGLEMPHGQAATIRTCAALFILFVRPFNRLISICVAAVSVGSYLLEGHTAAAGSAAWLPLLLFAHIAVVHWWIGSLVPLAAVALNPDEAAKVVKRFGQLAFPLVAILVVTGIFLLAGLTHWTVDLGSPYQLYFALKGCVVAALLGVASWNKFQLTPLFACNPEKAGQMLRASISVETALALLVLALTALLISSSPANQ